jgi:hypothetical protein
MRTAACFLLLFAWTGSGCISFPKSTLEAKAPTTTPPGVPQRPPTVVAPDEINESNARIKYQAVVNEMDLEAATPPPPASKPERSLKTGVGK